METRSEIRTTEWIDRELAALLSADGWTPDPGQGLRRLKQRREQLRRRHRVAAWTLTAALTVTAGAMSFPETRAYAQKCVEVCVAAIRDSR